MGKGYGCVETRYFISSPSVRDVRLSRAVRRHWGIENSLHWILDIAFRDISTGHVARHMALLRRLVLNLLMLANISSHRRPVATDRA